MKSPGNRIDPKLIKIDGQYLVEDQMYSLCTNNFMKNVDEILKKCPIKVSRNFLNLDHFKSPFSIRYRVHFFR